MLQKLRKELYIFAQFQFETKKGLKTWLLTGSQSWNIVGTIARWVYNFAWLPYTAFQMKILEIPFTEYGHVSRQHVARNFDTV